MGKKAQPKKSKAARSARKEPKGKPKKPQAAKPRAAARPSAAKRKAVTRKPKTPARPKKAAPARAKRKTAASGEKRTRAVERLMAMKSAKPDTTARKGKEGFLIKAPKKSKTENLMTGPRFVRNIAPAPKPAPALAPKPPAPPRKAILRKKDLEELRQALLEERQRLIAQLAALDEIASLTGPSEVNENIPGYSIHLAEYATDNQVVETTLAQRTLQAERLAEIETALQRIQQPGYGICRNCGNPISMERLKIKPSAEFCVPCRQLKEQGKL